jgi:lysophospholipase L1-like esterase
MLKPAIILVTLVVIALAAYAAYAARATWIRDKIAMLSAPASSVHAAGNASLPAKGTKPRVVLIGDSRIAQWPLAALSERFEIINRGVGGETVPQIAQRFGTDAIALKPDAIVIEAGINDLVAAVFMDEPEKRRVAGNIGETLRRLAAQAAASGSRVFVATVIPPGRPDLFRLQVWKESLRDLVVETNADLRRSRWPERVSLMDLSPVLLSGDQRQLPDAYRLDTLHLNEAGYQRMTEALASHLQSHLR